MDFDPHTIQVILQKIEQQMRCPQCGKKVPADFNALKLVAGNALVLQLRCADCDTHIVLQASLQDQAKKDLQLSANHIDTSVNASSALNINPDELLALRKAVAESGGSFTTLFKSAPNTHGSSQSASSVDSDTQIV
jgi:hypothetical protein